MNEKAKTYTHLVFFYIKRKVLFAFILVSAAVLMTFFQQDIRDFLNQLLGRVPDIVTFSYRDIALESYEGNVRILNSNNSVVYEGMYMDGACNGKGSIYDGKGHMVYRGELVYNVMQDDDGKLYYENGTLAYQGQVQQNQKEGMGTQYREDGTLEYEGEFTLDQFSGHGKAYNKKEQLIYEGDYLRGQSHGKGIAYEHSPRKRMVYEGDFAFGKPQGQGTFYDTLGKAMYTGAVYQGHMDITSFLPSTLAEVEASFHTPYDIYVYNMKVQVEVDGKQESKMVQKTAIVYPRHQLIFFTQYPLMITKTGDSWKLSDEIDKSDCYIDSIEMIDTNLDNPTMSLLSETITDAWKNRSTARMVEKKMDYFDVFALYYSTNMATTQHKKNYQITAHGNRIYEMEYHKEMQKTTRMMYLVDPYSIGYGYLANSNCLLYSVLLDEHLEVHAK